ncbi:MAG: T9SS type A sorting domain-containing protein [Cytophagaceae bacterium]
MKKTLLSFAAGMMALSFASAQTNSITSENQPTSSGEGYNFNFKGNAVDNCVGDKINPSHLSNSAYTVGIDEANNYLKIEPTNENRESYQGVVIQFYNDNCNSYFIDLTNNTQVEVKVRSSVDVADFAFALGGTSVGGSTWIVGDKDLAGTALTANQWKVIKMTLPTVTWNDIQLDKENVRGIQFFIRNAAKPHPVGLIEIEYVKVADAIVSAVKPSVDNNLVSLFPNPSNDIVNLDLSALNGQAAVVKVLNASGLVMSEETVSAGTYNFSVSNFEKGFYMIQVTSGNKVSNKKLVVK